MRAAFAALAVLVLLLASGCRTAPPPRLLPGDDPRPRAWLDAWREHVGDRHALSALARFSVDAPGAGEGGGDLSLRSKQRLWLARPARLRVEVLGFLDTTVAVLTTDDSEYALFQTDDRTFDTGPVYAGLLWDAARLDLSPREAVEVILGAPRPDAGLETGAAWQVGERVRVELVDAAGVARRVVEFGAAGWIRRLEQRGSRGEPLWDARWDDYVEIDGSPFAREVALHSAVSDSDALLRLRRVELDPTLSSDLFRLVAPGAGAAGAAPMEVAE